MLVGGAFLVAGLIRLRDSEELARTLETLRVFPHGAILWIAWVLPALEAISGGLILAGIRSRGAASGLLLMTGGMFAAVSLALARGIKIEWGVFAQLGGRLTGVMMLATYAALGFVTVLLILNPVQRTARTRARPRTRFRLPRLSIPQNHR